MIAIIDYGMGNLRSVQKAFEFVGHDARITSDPAELCHATHIVLPGVGAFGDAVAALSERGMDNAIREQASLGKPFLGICLGMQLLFDKSFEYGEHRGLGLVPGEVIPFNVPTLRVPHVGWNDLSIKQTDTVTTQQGEYVYFVHSYHAANVPAEYVLATSFYGYEFTAAVRRGNIYGFQFHPEKSGDAGLDMIKRFGGLR